LTALPPATNRVFLIFTAPHLRFGSRLPTRVHAVGGAIGPQIWHASSIKSKTTDWEPGAPVESPSGLEEPGVERGVAMSDNDIADTIAAFAKAAADAKQMGFDCIEMHGAHGYLIDQFFWGWDQ
jgi:2,4-dienoyl-CoA reductase-like NADH-dependent reductase (Old Yellow Enzyme family)